MPGFRERRSLHPQLLRTMTAQETKPAPLQETNPLKIRKYPSLNGLRAISVLIVVIHHLEQQYKIFSGLDTIRGLKSILWFIQDGQLGVNVFFVISGFLITSLLIKEELKTKTVSLKNFFARRTLRIFPAFFFLLGVYFLMQLAGYIHISGESWLTAITYTKYFNWQLDHMTGHIWSLSIEEHFYLLWPLAFLAGKSTRKVTAIILVLMVPLIRSVTHFYPVSWINELTIFMRIDSIALGCLFAIYQEQIIRLLSPHWMKAFVVSILGLFFLRCYPHLLEKVHLDFLLIPFGSTTGMVANICIALIMMYSVFGPNGLWFKFLNLRLLSYIGVLSYSIYLWQQPLIYDTQYWYNQYPQNLFYLAVMALFSFYIIEMPFLKLKARYSAAKERKKKAAEGTAPQAEAGAALLTPASPSGKQ